ncbi:MAG: flagellar biosynthesis protein FlhB [Sedimentisphaerales bacterium]|nr:flagellar biosynthesis protein FlhB [Sedimentisphaerales bacterium]
MAEKPAAERTEQPTSRRLNKARQEGQVPQSQELAAAATLVTLLLTLTLLAPKLLNWFQSVVRSGFSGQTGVFDNQATFAHFMKAQILDATLLALPVLAALMAAGILSGLTISGYSFAPRAVRFNWNAINPVTVVQNLFSMRSLVRFLTSIAKLFFVGIIVWVYLRDKTEALAAIRWAWSTQIIVAIAKLIFGLCLRVSVAIIAIGIADVFYQKWQYIQQLKMTRQEVKQERKETDGAPEVKSRIRRIQMQMSMKRLVQEVPKADVILVNPTHVAVALRYDAKTMEAPILLAKGADHLAEKIIKLGRSHGVPIVRRPEVARAVYASVKPGEPIPEAFYVAVAEVLAMLYRLRQKNRTPGQQ